jgi:hypothetical protein
MSGLPWSFHMERDPLRKIRLLSMIVGVTEWSDDVEFQPAMLINHETYKPTLLFPDVKPAKPYTKDPATYIEYRNGDGRTWRCRNIQLPMGEGLSTVTEERIEINDEGSTHGRVWFTGPVVFPGLVEVVGGSERIWMSITPMEVFTCRDGVKFAARAAKKRGRVASYEGAPKQKVVIAGLGLGWILEKVAALKDVKEIVVVEQSKGLLDWYGAELCARTKKVTELLCADYWEVAANYPDHFHVIDIWPNLGGAFEDEHLSEPPFDSYGGPIDYWAWGYQFGEDLDNDNVLDEDEAVSKQLGEDDEDEDDED